MLSLIEVKCPHCGAQGQIMLPPLGAIIIGPCPECQEMVMVFSGKVIALDKEVMNNGTLVERKEHLMGVLNDFLSDRVDRLLEENDVSDPSIQEMPTEDEMSDDAEAASSEEKPTTPQGHRAVHFEEYKRPEPVDRSISEDEFSEFVNRDLRLIDNKDYFRAVFE